MNDTVGDMFEVVIDDDPWKASLMWVNIAKLAISEISSSHVVVNKIDGILNDLKSSVISKNIPEIEKIAYLIEGEEDEDSLLTQGYLFEEENKDEKLYGLTMEAATQCINTLYNSKYIRNVPGWFMESSPELMAEIFSLIKECGLL